LDFILLKFWLKRSDHHQQRLSKILDSQKHLIQKELNYYWIKIHLIVLFF